MSEAASQVRGRQRSWSSSEATVHQAPGKCALPKSGHSPEVAWNLAHEAVSCVIPTLSQEVEDPEHPARRIEDKRAELAGVPTASVLMDDEIARIREMGENHGSVPLKGASRQYSGVPRADQWPITAPLEDVARRWRIEPDRDLYVPDDLRDLRERGAPRGDGAVQAADRRLFVHLQAVTGVADTTELLAAFGAVRRRGRHLRERHRSVRSGARRCERGRRRAGDHDAPARRRRCVIGMPAGPQTGDVRSHLRIRPGARA